MARYFSQRALRAEVVNKYDMNYIIRSIQPSLANDSAESSMHFRSINSRCGCRHTLLTHVA